jgi:hypothetical protein
MDYITGIELVKQRMREIGKSPEEYHFEVAHVVGTTEERSKGRIRLNAFNQYYYLINFEKYYGLEIISDTGYFNSFDLTSNTILEYTGDIIIQKLNPALPWSIADESGHDATMHPVIFIKATIF